MDSSFNDTGYERVILCENVGEAFARSERLLELVRERAGVRRQPEDAGRYLLGVYEHLLSGQVGLRVPKNQELLMTSQSEIADAMYLDPYWVPWEDINGDPRLTLGCLPFGQFGIGMVNPLAVRAAMERTQPASLLESIRSSTRCYTRKTQKRSQEMIEQLAGEPDIAAAVNGLSDPDAFEELVAELLRSQGFNVFLTSRTRDGGKDIWATIDRDGEVSIMLVECKIRSGSRAVDPLVARAVVGVYAIERERGVDVRNAMLVTTSSNLGPETIQVTQDFRAFSAIDASGLADWVSAYATMRGGMWIPVGIG